MMTMPGLLKRPSTGATQTLPIPSLHSQNFFPSQRFENKNPIIILYVLKCFRHFSIAFSITPKVLSMATKLYVSSVSQP